MEEKIDKLKYPIGKFQNPDQIDQMQIEHWIKILEEFPEKLSAEVKNLSEADFGKQYRPNGWTIRQVVNHCADSHMNSFIRFKLALTEDTPTIKPYFEDRWAELPDTEDFPIYSSLQLLAGLHARWVYLLRSLTYEDWNKEFKHPETGRLISLRTNLGIYAWHCEHHLAHVRNAKIQAQ
jgi:hypothetical protein